MILQGTRNWIHGTIVSIVAVAFCCADETPNSEVAALRFELAKQRQQYSVLAATVLDAKKGEQLANEQLASVRQRLEAWGKNLLDGGDERLVQAAADQAIMQERLNAIEQASMQISGAVDEFLREAVIANPESRLRLESAKRLLDAELGLRNKPKAQYKTGNLQRAQVVSIDAESGMLIFNIGLENQCRIGMTYTLQRGDRPYGKASVAEVRKHVCGALIESIEPAHEIVRMGDLAILETQQR